MTKIPTSIITGLSKTLSEVYTLNHLKSTFENAEVSICDTDHNLSKPDTIRDVLQKVNKQSEQPLITLGKILEVYIELPSICNEREKDVKEKILQLLQDNGLIYSEGGIIRKNEVSSISFQLEKLIKDKNIPAIEDEFFRAINNVSVQPKEAISAACNILESICKCYIAENGLEMPKTKDISSLWKVVSKNLGFDPDKQADDDMKKILSGMITIVQGIGAFRTHASTAHGQGPKMYNVKSRHAQFTVNTAHTLALFILQTWNEKKHNK